MSGSRHNHAPGLVQRDKFSTTSTGEQQHNAWRARRGSVYYDHHHQNRTIARSLLRSISSSISHNGSAGAVAMIRAAVRCRRHSWVEVVTLTVPAVWVRPTATVASTDHLWWDRRTTPGRIPWRRHRFSLRTRSSPSPASTATATQDGEQQKPADG